MRTVAKLCEYIEVNPKELLAKGAVVKKVSMDKLQPFCRDIPEYEWAEFSGGSKFRNRDTIMARITPCLENGKTAMVDILDPEEVGFGSTEFIVFRAKDGYTIPDFVYYLIRSHIIREPAIKSMVGSSGRQRVQTDVIRDLEVSFPDCDEQEKIVNILRSLDDKIALNCNINNNLQKQLHLLFVQIFNGISEDVVLGDVVETTSGGTPSRKHIEYYENGAICWVKSKELPSNYIHDTEEHINNLALSKSSAKLLPDHSVLIAMYGATVGAYGIISKPMACNQAVCALLSNEKYPYTYLFQMAQEQQQKLINMAVGSAQQNISQILIKQLPLHSDVATIRKFHTVAQPLHKQIEQLQAENRTLSETRNTLLPKLMSGELDVSDIDI